MPEGYIWPKSCISCGGMNLEKLMRHPLTYSKSEQIGNQIRTITLPFEVYSCEDCNNHKNVKKFYKFDYDFIRSYMKFRFKSPVFTKIFKDHNPAAWVYIDAINYFPADHDEKVFIAPQEGRKLSKEESKEYMKLARSKDDNEKIQVVLQEDLPEKLLRKFIARDNKNGKVQYAIAKQRKEISTEVTRILSEKNNAAVRLAIAERKALPIKIINQLLIDWYEPIREATYIAHLRNVDVNRGHEDMMEQLQKRKEETPSIPFGQPSTQLATPASAIASTCPSCGHLVGDAEFCKNCGRFLVS